MIIRISCIVQYLRQLGFSGTLKNRMNSLDGRFVEKYQPIKWYPLFAEALLLFRQHTGSRDRVISNPECCNLDFIGENDYFSRLHDIP